MNLDFKQIPITDLKGVGEKTAKLYEKLNILTLQELLEYYPKDYIKYLPAKKISELSEGEKCAVQCKVCEDFYQRKTARNIISTVTARDETGRIHLTFFHMNYLRNVLKFQAEYVFYGKVSKHGNEFLMEQPAIIKVEDYNKMLSSLQPVYNLTKGITSKNISKQVEKTLKEYGKITDAFSDEFIKKYELTDYYHALCGIHFPKNYEEFLQARKRLVFEEFYGFFEELNKRIENQNSIPSEYPMIETAECTRFLEVLPYELTNAQKRTLNEIFKDLCSGFVMNRLVQGDVGSGKTILAFLSMLLCVSNGYQCALMAPTEVLSLQHFEELKKFSEKFHLPFKLAFLSGSTTAKNKKEIYTALEEGTYNCVIGTHAIFQEKVIFKNLGLVITDEQHRFGVKQREELKNKGGKPHVLVMSATPIPRTLASVLYGDLGVSLVDEMPSQRLKIKSVIIRGNQRPSGYNHILNQINEGRQAYIICPMVEENEMSELENVVDYTQKIKNYFPDHIRIGTLHGRMKNTEKNKIMNLFAKHEIDILVSTTVIEVGINVPNATVIMIENAERFGLAALHQLRGRVGRGQYQSYCIFVNSKTEQEHNERLDVLLKSTDGFYIANEDLRLRGPGDILGVRQSGEMLFKIGDIYQDQKLLIMAKEAVANKEH